MNYIYRIYDENNTLLYVGKTYNLKRRFKQHQQDKFWWYEVDHIEFAFVEQKHMHSIYENYYINQGTKYNVKDTNIKYKTFNFAELTFLRYTEKIN